MPYLVRPRVIQSGPREFVVVVYVLDTTNGAATETHFVTRIERTGSRARRAVDECTREVLERLGAPAEVAIDDAQAKAALARVK